MQACIASANAEAGAVPSAATEPAFTAREVVELGLGVGDVDAVLQRALSAVGGAAPVSARVTWLLS